MKLQVDIDWQGKMALDAYIGEHTVRMDLSDLHGGDNTGPRPKPLLLASLGGCTAVDVISILKKMRVELMDLQIELEANQTDVHPKIYDTIVMHYRAKGEGLTLEKLIKAIEISKEKYCGVSAMLEKTVNITYTAELID